MTASYKISALAVMGEFFGVPLFTLFGSFGGAAANGAALAVYVYATISVSGGQLNPAVRCLIPETLFEPPSRLVFFPCIANHFDCTYHLLPILFPHRLVLVTSFFNPELLVHCFQPQHPHQLLTHRIEISHTINGRVAVEEVAVELENLLAVFTPPIYLPHTLQHLFTAFQSMLYFDAVPLLHKCQPLEGSL